MNQKNQKNHSLSMGVNSAFDSKNFFSSYKLISKENFTLYLQKDSTDIFYKVNDSGSKYSLSINPITNLETIQSSVDFFQILSTSDPICKIKRKVYVGDLNDIVYDKINYLPFHDPHAIISIHSDFPIIPKFKLSLARPLIVEYFIRHKPEYFKQFFANSSHLFEFRSPSLTAKQWDKFLKLYDGETLFCLKELIEGKAICKINMTPPDESNPA